MSDLQLRNDFFENEKVLSLTEIGGCKFVIMYLKLLLASKRYKYGWRIREYRQDLFGVEDSLSRIFNEDDDSTSEFLNAACQLGIVRIYDEIGIVATKDVNVGGLPGRNRATTEYKEWRRAVFTRDDWTCQLCGKRGGRLQAHHIKKWSEFPELRYEVSNGTTLCESCHRTVHRKGGGFRG